MFCKTIMTVILVTCSLAGCTPPILDDGHALRVDSSVLRMVERSYDASIPGRIVMTGTNVPTIIRFALTNEAIFVCESDDFSLAIVNASTPTRDDIISEVTIINDVRHKRWMIWRRYEDAARDVYDEYSFGKITDGMIQELRLTRMKDVKITLMPNWYDW